MISNQSSAYGSSGEASLSEKISELFQNETGSFEGKWMAVGGLDGIWLNVPTPLFPLFSLITPAHSSP